jgi:Holliday junction resolvase RusA-like endonuclease
MKKYDIKPVPAPRMTQRDKWAKRPCVTRYFNFRDEVNSTDLSINKGGTIIIFDIEMPKSWSKKKRDEKRHQPHDQKPDIDNLCKSLLDALFIEDKEIYNIIPYKFWADKNAIHIEHTQSKAREDLIKKQTN